MPTVSTPLVVGSIIAKSHIDLIILCFPEKYCHTTSRSYILNEELVGLLLSHPGRKPRHSIPQALGGHRVAKLSLEQAVHPVLPMSWHRLARK